MKTTIPSFVRRTFTIFLITACIFLLARLAMLVLVLDEVSGLPFGDTLKALYIGAKFDLRFVVFLSIPAALVLGIPWLERRLDRLRPLLIGIYAVAMTAVTIIYVLDFGFYFYLRQRMDSTLFELLPDFAISMSMVWQSYPVIRIGLGLIALILALIWLMRRMLHGYVPTGTLGAKRRAGWTLCLVVIFFLVAYGQISSNLFPLRWSNAYFSPNRFLVILALNPVQNLWDSYKAMKASQPDMQAVRAAYPREAARLGVTDPDPDRLNLWRISPGVEKERPNFVIIFMESLGTPRTSLASGLFEPGYISKDPGPDDPTPNIRALAQDSLYFPWFVAPTRTTARAIFTTITGIPDVNRSGGTSSRNPALVDQFTIVNEFTDYDKFYMLGGSASWANIRGVLTYNIKELNLLEEGHWKAPNTDVWGISDLALLRESLDVLDAGTRPFISFIQTAGFHRPWTIPADNAGFESRQVDDEVIKYYGFENVDEYNSMRFADHALGEFLRLARKRPWFDNTVFVIFGDHGLNEPSSNVPGGYLGCRLQSNHVPLLLYAPDRPDLFQPGVIDVPSGQPDILPTLAALAGIDFRNHGMGRNLLDPQRIRNTAAGLESQFLGGDAEGFVRVIQDGYCYLNEQQEALFLLNSSGENLLEQEPERARSMREQGADAFHVSKYLLYFNHKEKAPPLP